MRLLLPLLPAFFILSCSPTSAPTRAEAPPPSSRNEKAPGSTESRSPTPEPGKTANAPDSPFATTPMTATSAQALVNYPDRSAEDRKKDALRHPKETLIFLGLKPGQRVADLGAGDGYSTELIARAIGEEGVVYAHNEPEVLEKYVGESWPARLALPTMKKVSRVDAEWAAALPKEAHDLDLVTILFSYHDVVAGESELSKLNDAVFAALKPGGLYVISDHHAPVEGRPCPARAGREREEKKSKKPIDCVERVLHRIHRDRVIHEVQLSGFLLIEEGQFLRDPSDDRSQPSYKIGFKTDRFILKFQKPTSAGPTGRQGRTEGLKMMLDDGSYILTPYSDQGLDWCAMVDVDLRGRKSPHRPPEKRKKCRVRWSELDAGTQVDSSPALAPW